MITCRFEDNGEAKLRHVVTHALVEQHGKILLVKRAGAILETGKWGLPGGYLDLNETLAEGVLRELKEETGWEGEVVSFFRINSDPYVKNEDRQNVRVEFLVKPIRQSGTPDQESSEIAWFSEEELPPPELSAFDHKTSVKLYFQYLRKPFPLPIIE